MPTQPTQPAQPPKPSTPPPKPPPQPAPPPKPAAQASPKAEPLPIGAKPKDPNDPQAAKFEAHAAPPHWQEPKDASEQPSPAFTPEPALDPRAQEPPVGAYVDGMPIADEQRARAAWVEAHGMKEYHDAVDQRDEEPKQVPGVAPPTKRE
jgi:hypothetical protein